MGTKSKAYHLSPRTLYDMRARISAAAIHKRLVRFIDGEIELSPAQVTAALGLLRKVLPDAVEKLEVDVRAAFVIRAPQVSPTVEQWALDATAQAMTEGVAALIEHKKDDDEEST